MTECFDRDSVASILERRGFFTKRRPHRYRPDGHMKPAALRRFELMRRAEDVDKRVRAEIEAGERCPCGSTDVSGVFERHTVRDYSEKFIPRYRCTPCAVRADMEIECESCHVALTDENYSHASPGLFPNACNKCSAIFERELRGPRI